MTVPPPLRIVKVFGVWDVTGLALYHALMGLMRLWEGDVSRIGLAIAGPFFVLWALPLASLSSWAFIKSDPSRARGKVLGAWQVAGLMTLQGGLTAAMVLAENPVSVWAFALPAILMLGLLHGGAWVARASQRWRAMVENNAGHPDHI